MKINESIFKKQRLNGHKQTLWLKFKEAQHNFDKELDFKNQIYAHETKNENDEFKIIAALYVNSREADMLDPLFNDYTYSINRNVTIQETKMLLSKARRGKSPGVDNLPYEIFQNDTMWL